MRPTPRLDSLLDRLTRALDERGAKTALAATIAREAGIGLQTAKNRLSRILAREMLPNGEDTLLLAEWLESRTGTRRKTTAPLSGRRG